LPIIKFILVTNPYPGEAALQMPLYVTNLRYWIWNSTKNHKL